MTIRASSVNDQNAPKNKDKRLQITCYGPINSKDVCIILSNRLSRTLKRSKKAKYKVRRISKLVGSKRESVWFPEIINVH